MKQNSKKLSLGCGKTLLHSWINVDKVALIQEFLVLSFVLTVNIGQLTINNRYLSTVNFKLDLGASNPFGVIKF